MSIQVSEFRHIPGKNDAEYIKLLKESLERQKQITSKAIAKIKELSSSSESPSGWIPVSKELPKEPCRTQVTTEWAENDRTTEYVYYQGGEDKWGRLTNHVVAWAKLLDPHQPKEMNHDRY